MPNIITTEYIISHEDIKVEAWSEKNIPFEPQGWQLKMKEEMREALSKLSWSDKKELYASYYTKSDDKRKSDVENLLFYNIGSSAFKNYNGSSLCIERGGSTIPQPNNIPIPDEMSHYYKYELVEKVDFVIHQPQKTLAEWNGTTFNKIVLDKPSFFWNYIKRSNVNVVKKDHYGKFGIEVSIDTPRKKLNLTSIIKPLLDGLISAFHQQNKKNLTHEVLERLSNQIEYSTADTEKNLLEDKFNLFGKCDLVRKHGENGFKWYPADHLCDAIKIRVSHGKEHWKIDGKIFSI